MQRVVVTGYGVVSPLGKTARETWRSLVEGRSGVGGISLFDASSFEARVAAEVKGFDPALVLGKRAARRQDRFELLANVAVLEALEGSGLKITNANQYRIGTSISSAFGGLTSMNEEMVTLIEEGPKRLDPLGLTKFMTTTPSVNIAHELRGPSCSVASACASGADGVGLGFRLIRSGAVDGMLAGGVDAPITPLSVGTFDRMRAYSRRTDHTPSPFSADRDGLVLGEGAGVLVLERLEHALQRGAPIQAEIVGYAATTDAHHITAPLEGGESSAKAIKLALEEAGCEPTHIDYINAHGTGTPMNDAVETRAIKRALGDRAYAIPVSSTKSMTGHMMGGSGAVEAIFCIQAIQESVIPPTINYSQPDRACDLDYVSNEAREMPVRVALSNSFGFGGHNSVLVFRAFDGR